jgi:septal ring factor EnvC (AmiA/AmiB activator)
MPLRTSAGEPAQAVGAHFQIHFVFDGGLGKGEKESTMNLKRWFLWLCLALLVVGEVMLFKANQQRDAALVERDKARHEATQARADLEQFQASAAAAQGAEGDRLRRENQNLTQTITRLKTETSQLQQANRQLTQQLAAIGQTAQQQQAQLQQWDAASRQARAVAQQSQSQAEIERNACIANLKQIDAAKLQWALLNNKTEDAIPTAQDLLPYFKDGVYPVCPSGGTYTINSVGQAPTCSIPGHALPQ